MNLPECLTLAVVWVATATAAILLHEPAIFSAATFVTAFFALAYL